jgi:peptide deformylase
MALRRVLQIEQAADAAILRSKATRITSFDKSLQPLIDDMIETMRETDGVGLAAPQVGVLRRIVVIEQPAQYEEQEDGSVREVAPAELVVMINPEIIKASEETITMQEGCLSMPGRYGDVPRASWVTIKYQDIHGKEQRIRHASSDGYKIGRIAQHEIDHLDGVMFTDRMADITTLVDLREDPERPRRRRPLLRRRRSEADVGNPAQE